jgi:hypothetical protein
MILDLLRTYSRILMDTKELFRVHEVAKHHSVGQYEY